MAADHRAARGAGAAAQEGRQPARHDPRRPADPPGQRPGRRLEPGTPRPASSRSSGRTSPRASPSPRRRSSSSPASRCRRSPASRGWSPPPRRRVPVQRRADRLHRRHRPGALGAGAPRSRSTRSRARTRSTPARSTARGLPRRARRPASTLAADQLHPLAKEALASSGFADLIRTNMYASIVARAVELVHAFAEAIDIIDAYRRPGRAARALAEPARRRRLGHRGAARAALPPLRGGRGRPQSRSAQIVPPTSQNQAAIEADLVVAAKEVLELPHDAATHPPRADDPELRPLHQLRDPLPRSDHRQGVTVRRDPRPGRRTAERPDDCARPRLRLRRAHPRRRRRGLRRRRAALVRGPRAVATSSRSGSSTCSSSSTCRATGPASSSTRSPAWNPARCGCGRSRRSSTGPVPSSGRVARPSRAPRTSCRSSRC